MASMRGGGAGRAACASVCGPGSVDTDESESGIKRLNGVWHAIWRSLHPNGY